MRDIKFRAQVYTDHLSYPNSKLIGWAYFGYLDVDVNNASELLVQDDRAESEWPIGNIDSKTVGQYTGCKDRKGQEVYEGDIVRIDYGHWNQCWANGVPDDSRELGLPECAEHHYEIEEVIFTNGGFAPLYFAGDEGFPELDMFEVIGNVHENPELVNG